MKKSNILCSGFKPGSLDGRHRRYHRAYVNETDDLIPCLVRYYLEKNDPGTHHLKQCIKRHLGIGAKIDKFIFS